MSTLDIIIIIVIGVGTISGAVKGFIRDVFSLIAVVAGIIVALLFYERAAGYLVRIIPETTVARTVGFAVIFVAVAVIVSIIAHFLSKSLSPDVSPYDRFAGACFGFIKGLILVALILFILTVLVPGTVKGSRLAPPIMHGTDLVIDLFPKGVKEKIDRAKDALRLIGGAITTPEVQEKK